MNDTELTQYKADQEAAAALSAAHAAALAAATAARRSAITKLKTLGLTDAEIKALLP